MATVAAFGTDAADTTVAADATVSADAAVTAESTVTADASVAADSAVATCSTGDDPVAARCTAADANGFVPRHRWSHGRQRAGDARRRHLLRRAQRQEKHPPGRKFCIMRLNVVT